LRQHFQQVAEFGKGIFTEDGKPSSGNMLPAYIVDMAIEKLELTPRAYNSLKRANISRVGEVLDMSEDELLAVRNFGKKSLDELRERLTATGLDVEAANSTLLRSFGTAGPIDDIDEDDEV